MPKFDFNPNNIDLGFPIFPKDDYELELEEPKTFFRQAKGDQTEDKSGIAIMAKIVEGEHKGKKYYMSFDFNQEYGYQNAMNLLVTTAGFNANDEGLQRFRAEYGHLDFSVNTDTKTIGDGWNTVLKGQHVMVSLDQQAHPKEKNLDGSPKMVQSFPKFFPIQR